VSYSTTRFAIRIPDGIRTLFTVIEKPNGELVIPIKGADRFGADWKAGKRVLEQRYSIHSSPRSKEFNVIKQTINLEGGQSITMAALTDAVKLKNGFSIILVRRCQRLTDDPPEEIKPNEPAFVLPEFDPSFFTLFHAIFVGHPDTVFDASDPDVVAAAFPFKKFEIVVMASLRKLPSHRTTDFLHSVTMPPETKLDEQAVRRFLMTGRSPEICFQQYRNSVKLLTRRYLTLILETEDLSPKAVERIQQELAEIGDVELTLVEAGPNQPAIHMLTSGPLPDSRSSALHSEFLRGRANREDQSEK
jgi:hypothetical protein